MGVPLTVPMSHRISLAEPPVITAIGTSVKDQTDPYCAVGRWRLHFYATPVVMIADGVEHAIGSGWVGLWSPEIRLECRFVGRSLHTCAHFLLPLKGEEVGIARLQDLGERYAPLEQAFLEAVRWYEESPHRAEARLWDVLWQLVAPREPAPSDRHPALERACTFIHAHLATELSVDLIAEASRCSSNQVLRLFRRHLGLSTVAYIRRCRVQRAAYLLRESDIPIKEVAAEVGIPDLHFFNKVLRTSLGFSPRSLRQRSRG